MISGAGGAASPAGYGWFHSVVEVPATAKRIDMSAEAREKMRRGSGLIPRCSVVGTVRQPTRGLLFRPSNRHMLQLEPLSDAEIPIRAPRLFLSAE